MASGDCVSRSECATARVTEGTDRSNVIRCELSGRRVALVACGSFNPPTFMHLRMFERARDYLEKTHNCVVVEGILSPVADTFAKADLISAEHRLQMVQLAVRNSTWLRADGWECSQENWTRTLNVLQHFNKYLERKYGNCSSTVRLMLLCGGDVVESFAKTDMFGNRIWKPDHIEQIVRDYGLVVITRSNSDPMKTVYMVDVLRKLQKNIHIIEDETCPNNISSTRLRIAIRRGESIKYCTDDEVINYIQRHQLYSKSSVHRSCPTSVSTTATTASPISDAAGLPVAPATKVMSTSSSSSPASTDTVIKGPPKTLSGRSPPEPPKRMSSIVAQKNLFYQLPAAATTLPEESAASETIWYPSLTEERQDKNEANTMIDSRKLLFHQLTETDEKVVIGERDEEELQQEKHVFSDNRVGKSSRELSLPSDICKRDDIRRYQYEEHYPPSASASSVSLSQPASSLLKLKPISLPDDDTKLSQRAETSKKATSILTPAEECCLPSKSSSLPLSNHSSSSEHSNNQRNINDTKNDATNQDERKAQQVVVDHISTPLPKHLPMQSQTQTLMGIAPISTTTVKMPNLIAPSTRSISTLQQKQPAIAAQTTSSEEACAVGVGSWYRQSLESPNYDNVTLDELLAASTSWTEYLSAQRDEQHSYPRQRTEEAGLMMSSGYSLDSGDVHSDTAREHHPHGHQQTHNSSCLHSATQRPQLQLHYIANSNQIPPGQLIADPCVSTADTDFITNTALTSRTVPSHWREGVEQARSLSAPQRRSIRFACGGDQGIMQMGLSTECINKVDDEASCSRRLEPTSTVNESRGDIAGATPHQRSPSFGRISSTDANLRTTSSDGDVEHQGVDDNDKDDERAMPICDQSATTNTHSSSIHSSSMSMSSRSAISPTAATASSSGGANVTLTYRKYKLSNTPETTV
ncbi:unnamed protein product [Anisakis simplex]|uniref:Nicotinamide/nicotinic acid mononucleotide adenylyltransferase 3 n=1 Tax=Anisakis simplex TaxID=6269 RepID=A0A0M3K051_ANISI|nr:unnamed protein product [Anisakis simplex]